MSKIINFPGSTKLPLGPDKILEQLKGELNGFVICGRDRNDDIFFASTYNDGPSILWLMEKCKQTLLHMSYEDDDT